MFALHSAPAVFLSCSVVPLPRPLVPLSLPPVLLSTISYSVALSVGVGAIGGERDRFSPALDLPPSPNVGALSPSPVAGKTRFPPIGLDKSTPISTNKANSTASNGGAAPGVSPHPNRPRREYGAVPSYMQPTENAQNHLAANERDDRAKSEHGRTERIRSIVPNMGLPVPLTSPTTNSSNSTNNQGNTFLIYIYLYICISYVSCNVLPLFIWYCPLCYI